MRKYHLLFFFLIVVNAGFGQQSISKITKSYFRSNPFEGDFSSFLSHLLNDPAITSKILEKKTDTSLFYFQGTYRNFNPFFFKPTRVQVMLTELLVPIDSLEQDTIYTYQLFAYQDANPDGIRDVKKEFDKLFKKYKGNFQSNQYLENPPESKSPGGTYNFFDLYHGVAPFALSWFGPTPKKEVCLVLTIRMDTQYNQAVLPVPFYAPK